ncbi:MAG: hypothetical protein NXI02_29690 [Rhodobacteraceae bacterium]|nr:hypothetical protein [Paracoccaceae bacterium]
MKRIKIACVQPGDILFNSAPGEDLQDDPYCNRWCGVAANDLHAAQLLHWLDFG